MKKHQNGLTATVTIRQKAELLKKKRSDNTDYQPSEDDILILFHELQVHQIELELMNEELILAKEKSEAATQKYIELYDFAPSGYFTLSKESKILEVNFHGAKLLGLERHLIINIRLYYFVSDDTKPIFDMFLSNVFRGKTTESCEVTLISGTSLHKLVYLTGIISGNDEQCQITMVDITELRQAEETRRIKESLEMLNIHEEEIRENERALISGEIHDKLGQTLSALKMDLHWFISKKNFGFAEDKKLKGMIELIDTVIHDVQRIAIELRPPMLDDLGLNPTLEWYINEFKDRTGINCTIKLEDVQFPDEKKNLTLYRLIQEALTNVIRHANAKNVTIKLYRAEDSIIMEIIDDGIGMEKEKIDSYMSFGFICMRERIKKYNGRMDVISTLNKGTKICFNIPYD